MSEFGGGFPGKVALVTGAASGFGRDAAMALVERGARVVVTGTALPVDGGRLA